ncbi:MAG: PAS domain S-box-containing protein [Psychroserpens sp.]|jgi:PAS domain S-box-containing protein
MSKRNELSKTHLQLKLPILEILENSGICYSIKNSHSEYVGYNAAFLSLLDISGDFRTDFDILIPEIAYNLSHEDSLIFKYSLPTEQDRVLISKSGKESIVNISRSIVEHNGEQLLVSILKDITIKSQEAQFDAYKQVFSETDVFEKILNRFSTLIFSSDTVQDVFEGVGNLSLELLELEYLSIFLVDHKTQLLKQTLILDRDQEIQYDSEGAGFIAIALDKGLTGRCVTALETIIINDVSLDQDYISDRIECKSEIAVPIVFRNQVLGVIDSESTKIGRYNDQIKRVLEGIASLLAIKLNELEKIEALESKNEELVSLIKSHPAGMAMLDKDGNFIAVSQSWLNQFTKSKNSSLNGVNFFKRYPNLPIRWVKSIERGFKGKSRASKGEIYTNHKGQLEFMDVSVSPWFNLANEIAGVVLMADNVTEQVQNKLDLLQTTEKLTETSSIAGIFNWSFNIESGYLQWDENDILVEDFPSDTKFDLDAVFQLIDQDYHIDINNAISKAIKDNTSFEIIHPFNLGENRYWLHNRGKVSSENGVIIEIEGSAQDITNQVDTENAIRKQNLALRKINQELDQFVYKTAHDLRAPLTNLTGLIGIMRMEQNPQVLNSYFDLQEKSIQKLDNFIQKITANTKNSRLSLLNEKLDFPIIVDEVLRAHYFFENSEKISKILNIQRDLDFYGDSERVKIILNNLVSNAIEFCDLSKENPKIEIEISAINGLTRLRVRDNGVGIEEQYQPKVYDMFYRAHKKAEGAGIGLYIVKETVKKLNGSIHLASELDEFTEINVFLPSNKPKN